MPTIPRDLRHQLLLSLNIPAYSSSLVAAGGSVHTGQIQGDAQVASQEVGWANTLEDFAL